jgi:hypothetical protein
MSQCEHVNLVRLSATKDIWVCKDCAKEIIKMPKPIQYCQNERPPRDVVCQEPKGHKGHHRAVIFWE